MISEHKRKDREFTEKRSEQNWDTLKILLDQPQLASCFDLSKWNDVKDNNYYWAELLRRHPQYADQCDFSTITGCAAERLLKRQPQFLGRIRIETIKPHHWTKLINCQPQIKQAMDASPHSEWPFNYWVHAVQFHPELEPEFDGWDKIDWSDAEDFRCRQPGMYQRHHLERISSEKA